jgi:preprotein translocase subunit SecA
LQYLADAVDSTIESHCVAEFSEEWDVEGLVVELAGLYPTKLTAEQIGQANATDEIYDMVMAEASAYYERRETDLGPELMREVERQVMLRIIDQRWREHLYEMDYLMEGINLRAMGQQDPLVAWQQDGFQMFGEMMHGIAQDFVRYVMHVQVVQQDQTSTTVVQNVQTHSAEDTPQGADAMQHAVVGPGDGGAEGGAPVPANAEAPTMQPVVKDEWSKTPRNAPCPCGSGKKFKLCHGK